jgi:nitronate monooxygenase
MKRLILESDGCDTTWTRSYDIALGLDFPDGIGARVHANSFTRRWDGREDQLRAQLSEVQADLDAFGLRGDEETFVMYGQSAAFVNEVQTIEAIMQRLATGLPASTT